MTHAGSHVDASRAVPSETGIPPRYAVITTIRNEERYIGQTAESLLAQTIQPSAWVIVDDGSTDTTPEIIGGYSDRNEWIRVVDLGRLGGTNRCIRVMRAFLAGYSELQGEFDFVIKSDGDVTFDPDHVERLLQHFAEDPGLGIASGSYIEPIGDGWRGGTRPEGYAVGALRAYRAECLRGVVEAVAPLCERVCSGDGDRERLDPKLILSWDSIDHLYAAEAGWSTQCFADPMFVHHRTEGSRSSILTGLYEQGVVSYVMGYHPLFAMARGVGRFAEHPYMVGGLAMNAGYLSAAMSPGIARADERTRRLVRKRHVHRMRGALRAGPGEKGKGEAS